MLTKLLQYAPVQILSALSVFILIAIQTKFLDVKDYGILAIFFLVTEVVRSLSAQWINTSMLRLYPAESKENKIHYQTVAVCLLIALFLPGTAIIATAIFYYDLFTWSTFFYLSLLLLSKSVYLFILDMARLNDQAGAYRLTSMLQSALSLLVTYVLLNYHASFESAVLGLIISYIVVLPFGMFRLPLSKLSASKAFVMPVIHYGVPLMLSGTLVSLTSRVDRLFIADTLGLNATGVYSALSNLLLGIMSLVFMVVAMPLYPEMTKAINNKVKLRKLHAEYVNTLLLLTLPALFGLCIIAEPLISIFLRDEYLQYGVNLFYIIASSIFILNCRAHYIDHGLQFTLNTGLLPIITGVNISINITLLLLLIEPYGVYGAAYASLCANIVSLFLSFAVARYKGYQYQFNIDVVKIVLASVTMAFFMFTVKSATDSFSKTSQLISLISCGLITYVVINLALNTFNGRSYLRKVLFK